MKTLKTTLLISLFLSQILESNEILSSKNLDTIETNANQENDFESELSKDKISQKEATKYLITSTTDIQKIVPSLRIYPQGSDTFPMISYRGISSPDYYSSILGIYIDDIPQAPNFLIQNLSDIQSIQVIPGSLGILYGENAPLGVIDIKTKNPMQGDYLESEIGVSRLQERIRLNVGHELIKNKLWGKLSTQYIHDNGYIYNPINNQPLNTSDSFIIGTSLYFQPLDAMLISLHYDYQLLNSHKDFYLTHKQALSLKLDSGELASWNDFTNGEQNKILNINPYNYAQTHNASMKIDSSIENFDLRITTAFQSADSLANEYPGVYVTNTRTQGYYYNTKQFITEIRAQGHHKHNLTSTFGIFYKYLLLDNGMNGVDTTELGYSGNWDASEILNTFALFSAIGYQKNHFKINFGARYQFFYDQIQSNVPPVTEISPYSNHKIFNAFNPFLLLSYDYKQTRFYSQTSMTTKPGGFSKFPFADTDTMPYLEENIYSTEIGAQTHFSFGLAKVALYGIWRDNVQSYVGVGYYKSIKNIGSAYAYGIDANLNLHWKILSFFANLNLNLSRFNRGGKNIGTITILGENGSYNLSGLTPKFAPIFSLNTGVDVQLFHSGNHNVVLSLLLNTQSSYYLDDFNHDSSLIQKPYATLDTNLSYEFLKHYQIIFYAQNLTNTRVFTTAIWDSNGYAYITNAPINFGVRFIYQY